MGARWVPELRGCPAPLPWEPNRAQRGDTAPGGGDASPAAPTGCQSSPSSAKPQTARAHPMLGVQGCLSCSGNVTATCPCRWGRPVPELRASRHSGGQGMRAKLWAGRCQSLPLPLGRKRARAAPYAPQLPQGRLAAAEGGGGPARARAEESIACPGWEPPKESEEYPGGWSHPCPAPQPGLEAEGRRGKGQRRAGRSGWLRAGAGLGTGQAAHLAVVRARLVHEGAVLAGPHGRGHGV